MKDIEFSNMIKDTERCLLELVEHRHCKVCGCTIFRPHKCGCTEEEVLIRYELWDKTLCSNDCYKKYNQSLNNT